MSRITGIAIVSASVASIQWPGRGSFFALRFFLTLVTTSAIGCCAGVREISHQLASPAEMPAATPTSSMTEKATSQAEGPTAAMRAPPSGPPDSAASRPGHRAGAQAADEAPQRGRLQ